MPAHSIDWFNVEVKQSNLAEAMGFAYKGFGDSATSFFDKFQRSGFMKRFERGDGRATLGCSGCELALMINNRLGGRNQLADFEDRCNFTTITSPVEYWIGYALGYLQGRSGLPFSGIFSYIPLESWYGLHILHEVGDEALWDKTLGKHIDAKSAETCKFGGKEQAEHGADSSFPCHEG